MGALSAAAGLFLLAPGPAPTPLPPSPPAYEIAIREAFIPMPDGVRLAADLFLPTGGKPGERFPVLLEYLPYRKLESRDSNYGNYSYFVRRGYVVARVDIRGTGQSEGRLIPHEYSDIENQDGEVVIDWLSKQPFSTGQVGMFGISWGGFNSIHLAMRRPPALKAIIAVDATDDLYQDDVHYMDGMIHVDSWEMAQDLTNMMPGAPDFKIDEAYFANRFDTPPWILTYKRQQRYGPFWKRTTLKERYDAIRIPTFVIGGLYDGYRDSVPRMLEKMTVPVKAIMGAWHHSFPNDAYPKPQMEWRHEAVRWFDRWLKGRDTGIMEEPRFAVYVRRWHPPGPYLEEAPGEWRYEEGWPIRRIVDRVLHPQPDGGLSETVPGDVVHRLRNVPTNGIEAGGPVMWYGDVAPDQRPTDAWSLVYDSAPVAEDVEIIGLPKALLQVSADAPLAQWFVRLSDVAPDGTVTMVAQAGQNGAHRESDEHPKALEPGREFPLEIEMHFTTWVFAKGHRMRLAVNNAQWPMLWPTPHPLTTTLRLGPGTRVALPVVPHEDRPRPAFLPPAPDPDLPGYGTLQEETTSGYGEISRIERDVAKGATRMIATNGGGRVYPWGERRFEEKITHEANDKDPAVASVRGEYRNTLTLSAGRTLVFEYDTQFRSDAQNFHYTGTKRLRENGVLVRERTWTDTIPRDHQ